jgi:hypothetical protein
MHYAYINGKRVSRHAMKDCMTFLKLQEAVGHKQAKARRQGYDRNTSNGPPASQQATNGAAQVQNQPSQGNKNDGGYIPWMTHKYRGCILVLSINKSVEPNEELKVLTSSFDQGFTVNTSKTGF